MTSKILTLGLAALIGCSALLPADAVAKKHQRVLGDGSLPMVKGVDKNSPMARHRAERGTRQLNSLHAERSGLLDLRRYKPMKERAASTRSMTNPRGHFIGAVGSYAAMEYFNQAFLGTIDAKTGHVESLFTSGALLNGNDYDIQGGFVRNGIYYTCLLEGDDQVVWARFDIENGSQLPPIRFDSSAFAYAYSMTYNEAEDLVYCLSIDLTSGADNMLVVFNPAGNFDLVSAVNLNTSNFVAGIAYNPKDQQVYAFDDSGRISIVESGKPTLIEAGEFLGDDVPIDSGVATQVCYSPLDECFAMVVRDPVRKIIRLGFFSDEDNEEAGLSAWEIMDGPELGSAQYVTPYFISLDCTDPFADNDATEIPAVPTINFEKNALSGTITVTVPSYYYSGASIPATEKVKMTVNIDDKEALAGDFAPGSVQTINSTLAQGEHVMTITCLTNGEKSPVRTINFYVGNDNPKAVTNLNLDGNTLTWTAPGDKGVHNGYVDTAALTYDVLIGGKKQNSEPITATTYTFEVPADLQYTTIEVIASANGVSSAATSTVQVIGRALDLPVMLEPTVEESDLFQIINAPGHDSMFFLDQDQGFNMFRCYVGSADTADNWLFLPVAHFPTVDHLYNFAFTYANGMYEGKERLDIYLTKKVTTETSGMVNIMHQTSLDSPDPKYFSLNFGIPEAGDWYIAFHCTSHGESGGGVSLWDFAINGLTGSSDVPGDPQNVTFTPAPLGALSTKIDITAPVKNIIGKDLDASSDITFTVKCGENTITATAKPGQVASTEIAVASNGYATFEITPSNSKGSGLARDYRHYVGLDRPLCPTNIKCEPLDDNMTVNITWNRPGNVGENGGYVDAEALDYRVYNVTGAAYQQLGVTKDLNFKFTAAEKQEIYNLGPAAFNEVGESRYSQFVNDILGKPYLLPMVEEFGNNAFSYEPFYLNLTPPFENCAIQPITSVLSPSYEHGCTTDCEDGAIIVYNTSRHNCQGELVLPKFSTKSVEDATFSLRMIDFKDAPEVELWGRCAGNNDLKLFGKFTLNHPAKGEWVDAEVVIPAEYLDKGWVQCVLRFNLTTAAAEYAFIDGYSVSQNIDTDLGIKSVSGASTVYTGEQYSYSINMVNGGKELLRVGQGSLEISLLDKDGNRLTYQKMSTPRILPVTDIFFNYDVHVLENYAAVSPLTLEVKAYVEGDEVEWNNNASVTINVRDNEAPVVRDLTAKWDDDYSKVDLSWSEPDLDHSGYDGFELLQGFDNSDKLGQFVNVDMDKKIPFCFDGLRWEGDNTPMAWQVIDTDEVYPWKNDPRLGAHGGHKYLMARNPEYDLNTDENKTQAADWLISPEVVPGSELTFWYGTIDSSLTEYIELWVSSTDDTLGDEIVKASEETSVGATCGSFRYVRTFSKSGEDAWEEVKVTLPADAKYFALVYRSIDGFGVMLDDLTFDQAKTVRSELDHYAIWSLTNNDWKTWACVADDLHTTNFTDTKASKDVTNTYYVITYVKSGDSFVGGPKSNPAKVYGLGAESIDNAQRGVSGDKGQIIIRGYEGNVARIFMADGRLVRETTLTSESQNISLAPGIYAVRIGKADYKVIVK